MQNARLLDINKIFVVSSKCKKDRKCQRCNTICLCMLCMMFRLDPLLMYTVN